MAGDRKRGVARWLLQLGAAATVKAATSIRAREPAIEPPNAHNPSGGTEASGAMVVWTSPGWLNARALRLEKLLEVANTARRLQALRRSGDLSERATASREQPG